MRIEMDFPRLTPVETIMAHLGMMVRRARNGVLPRTECMATAAEIKDLVEQAGIDPTGILRARLNLLRIKAEARTLTADQFDEITTSLRVRLAEIRHGPPPVVPNFAVLPSGVHGRRIGFLTVVDGASNQPDTTLKGA